MCLGEGGREGGVVPELLGEQRLGEGRCELAVALFKDRAKDRIDGTHVTYSWEVTGQIFRSP